MARIDHWKTVPYRLSSVGSISAATATSFLLLLFTCCYYLLSSSVESLRNREFGSLITRERKRNEQYRFQKIEILTR